MYLVSEIVGQKGVYSFLNKMYEIREVVALTKLNQLMDEVNLSEISFSDLTKAGLFISTQHGFYISSLGKKVTLLLRGINNDSNIYDLFSQLTNLYPDSRPYELVTENITDYFIDSIQRNSDFIRLLICSPWIRLDKAHLDILQRSVTKASKMYKNLQIVVITKPKHGYNNWKASIETFKVLRSLGAEILNHTKLHTKLYISEPGPYGGAHYAILGSENLTGRRNIELAIRIENDNDMLRKLNQYFYEISQESEILKEVE